MKGGARDVIPIIATEYWGSNEKACVIYEEKNGKLIEKRKKAERWNWKKNKISELTKRFFIKAFLPDGYPQSVSSDYLNYQIWDSLQALCSSVTGLLATRAILQGVGVGNSEATASAAIVQWVIRDGTGMIGRIIFAWFQGTNLDANAKRWRFLADIFNDLAMTLELISPNFPHLFLPLICTSSVLKSIVGVAGGATRAAITQHQSRRNNMADVSAKDGSQETANALLGMLLGVLIAGPMFQSPSSIWILFFFFIFLHLFSNYKAVSSVSFDSLNRYRAKKLILNHLINNGRSKLSPLQVSLKEPILFEEKSYFNSIDIGAKLSSIHDPTSLRILMEEFEGEKYMIHFTKEKGVIIVLHQEATSLDILKSFYHVCLVEHYLQSKKQHLSTAESRRIVDQNFKQFIEQVEGDGWNVKYNLLSPNDWRSSWGQTRADYEEVDLRKKPSAGSEQRKI
eukprot:TRINITY_DN5025_c0_g1_i2.p2 TRINITY_DN5025_c0_g1~~TRINITY_DN5025_c0_g1_i2.p2  ORF type:complete len:454 (-),score=141.43 TRINITY_DN5025_c0_g1_i2:1556-2917(-)